MKIILVSGFILLGVLLPQEVIMAQSYLIDDLDSALAQNPESYQYLTLQYLDSARNSKDYVTIIYALSLLMRDKSLTEYQQGIYANQAKKLINKHSKKFFNADNDSSIFYNFYEGLAEYMYRQGDYASAISHYKKLINSRGHQTVEDSLYLTAYYSFLGSSYLSLENPDRAIFYYQKYLSLVPEGVVSYYGRDYLFFYKILGWSYLAGCWSQKISYEPENTAYYRSALLCYHKAINLIAELSHKENFTKTITSTYNGLIDLHQNHNAYDSAAFYLNQIDKYDSDSSYIYARLLMLKAQDVFRSDNPALALKYYDSAQVLNKKNFGENHFSNYNYLVEKAGIYVTQNKFDQALSMTQQALGLLSNLPKGKYANPVIDSVIFIPETIKTLTQKATAFEKYAKQRKDKQYFNLALDTYTLAVKLSLLDRGKDIRNKSKQESVQKHRNLISKALAACAASKGYLPETVISEKAFDFIEQGKALLLLENYREEEALRKASLPQEVVTEIADAESKLAHISRDLRDNGVNNSELFVRLKLAEEHYDSLMQVINQNYPEFKFFIGNYQKMTLHEFQINIGHKENYFSYYVGDSSVYLLVVDTEKVKFQRLGGTPGLQDKVQTVLQQVRNPDIENKKVLINELRDLYTLLIEPGKEILADDEKLTILPDSYLGYLVFDLLITEEPASMDYTNLPFMIKKWPISYDFSIGVLSQTEKQEQASYETNYLGFAPDYGDMVNVKDLMAENTLRAERDYGVLSYNMEEITYAGNLFGGQYYVGEEASESKFKNSTFNYGMLHLSMHAFFDEKNPDHSGLVFSDFNPEGIIEGDDGFVPITELYNMRINTELVILSACETGYGYLERGEGVASIGRAFKYAGCPAVTMSVWNANDQSTYQIMKYFTEALHEGKEKDVALQQAKLKYLETADNITGHPYYWSAFIINGPTSPLSFSQSTGWLLRDSHWILLLAGAIILVLLVFFYVKGSQR